MTTEGNEITSIELAVSALKDQPSADAVCDMISRLSYLERRIREVKKEFEPVLAEYLKEHGPISIGDVEYVYARDKKTECVDAADTLASLLDTFGGDMSSVCQAFSSQPFKYGFCKQSLHPKVYEKCFKTTVSDSYKVKQFNKAFVKHTSTPADAGKVDR